MVTRHGQLTYSVALTMTASSSDSDVDDPQASDAVEGPSESRSDLSTSRGRKMPRKVDEWGISVAKKN